MLIVLAILLLLPATALAATPADSTPTGQERYFFANGTPINITATAPSGEEATISGLTTGTAYISWVEEGTIKYVGVPATAIVFGGADGSSGAVSVESASYYHDRRHHIPPLWWQHGAGWHGLRWNFG